ncbi:MAG: UDP-N-acetylglucosamine 1-carboxyvinyltransferase [Elusimicrobiota bacterium]
MDRIIINGGKKLSGTVKISGAKNAALPILVATLLTDDKCVIDNVPELEDVNTVLALLEQLGKKIKKIKNQITVLPSRKIKTSAPEELVRKMRASVLVAGPLLARFKKVKIPLPGGCAIGIRPINIHLDGFKKLGANYSIMQGCVMLNTKRLTGRKIILDFPSVGATENILMAATLADGETIIENTAIEPEVTDLANFLVKAGAKISGVGTKVLRITGTKKLNSVEYKIIPDRIETGTFITAAAITSGNIKIVGSNPEYNESFIEKIKLANTKISVITSSIIVKGSNIIKPVDVKTAVYPCFPTDLQPMWMTLMTLAKGESVITETVFENRFQTGAELIKMGADIKIKGNLAIVKGVKKLTGAKVVASDLRSAAALILAGLAAKGKSEITGLEHLDRGYENSVAKFKQLGADIKRVIDN